MCFGAECCFWVLRLTISAAVSTLSFNLERVYMFCTEYCCVLRPTSPAVIISLCSYILATKMLFMGTCRCYRGWVFGSDAILMDWMKGDGWFAHSCRRRRAETRDRQHRTSHCFKQKNNAYRGRVSNFHSSMVGEVHIDGT